MSVPSSRRYLSVWLRRLPTDRIARRSSAPADSRWSSSRRSRARCGIAALNDAAARLGLKAGMALADARAMYPALAGRRCRSGSRPRVCSKRSPTGATATRRWSGSIRRTGLLLDITGCAHLFGGESGAGRDLVRRLARAGLSGARRGRRYGRLRLGGGALWRSRWHRPARRNEAAHRCRSRSRRCASMPDTVARWRRSASSASPTCSTARARRSPRASARTSCAASIRRSAARTSRSRRGCRCRPRWPSSASPSRSRSKPTCSAPSSSLRASLPRAGAARRRRAAVCRPRCSAPTARCIASRSAPARRCAIPRASASCSPTGSP